MQVQTDAFGWDNLARSRHGVELLGNSIGGALVCSRPQDSLYISVLCTTLNSFFGYSQGGGLRASACDHKCTVLYYTICSCLKTVFTSVYYAPPTIYLLDIVGVEAHGCLPVTIYVLYCAVVYCSVLYLLYILYRTYCTHCTTALYLRRGDELGHVLHGEGGHC